MNGDNIGDQVNTLHHLASLAADKRSVCAPGFRGLPFRKPKPAAFVINMSGQIILQLIASGLYVYEPKEKKVTSVDR